MLAFREDMKTPRGIKNNLSRLKRDAQIKGQQVDEIIRYLNGNPYPVIICGDFNSTRFTYVFNELISHYQNAFNQAGTGFGFSYNGRIKLPLKIDHQFYSKHFEVRSCVVDNSMLDSDHLPIIATYNYIGN
jgi:endonuclease/exonuclease/phosphatase (EEP) superfamily protein YafD